MATSRRTLRALTTLVAVAALCACGSGGDGDGDAGAGSGSTAGTAGGASGGAGAGAGAGSAGAGSAGGTGSGIGTGSGSGSGSAATAAVPSAGTLQSSTPAAGYAAGSDEAAAWSALNTVRRAAGAGLLNQSAQLDVAASAHANYLGANIGASGHGEDAAKFGFYEVSPASRVQKAGFAASFATEAISANNPLFNLFAFDCVRELLNSVYNAVALLGPATHVGFGLDSTHATTPLCISVLAAQASEPHGQVAAAGALLAYPYDGQADVIEDVDLNIESPRPSPAALPNAAAGTPVIVSVRNADYLNLQAAGSLNARVTKFELLDAGGNPVPAALLAHAALAGGPGVVLTEDANLPAGTVVLVPLSPLVRGQSYAVSFAATLQDGGAALQRSWSFTTRP